MRIRILVFLVLAVLLASLFIPSCGTGPDEPGETTEQPGDTSVTETEKTDETAGKDPAESETHMTVPDFDAYNYVIGTQAFSPNYQFTDRSPLSEISERIVDMGSNMIKFYATEDSMIDTLISERPELKYIFLWYRSDPYFQDGYSEQEAQNDYNAFYNLTRHLLTAYAGTGIEFYLGHWEGDWYYLKGYDTNTARVDETLTEGMIQWINNRQKAVDDAKASLSYEGVEVWNYLEVNRPTDALDKGFDRVVNKVLPYTNVDYVSYSAYDCMYLSQSKIHDVIEYIYDNLPVKPSVDGPRVFIGEFGQPAANCGFSDKEHARQNLEMFRKYLSCDVKFILFWQMYDNEKLEDGSCRGFWLINDKNEETLLYRTLAVALDHGKDYVREFWKTNGRLPSIDEYKDYLLTLDCFSA